MVKRDMTITEIINRYPQTIDVFHAFGLDCNECQIADYEDLEHGAGVHNVDIDRLLKELNRVVKESGESA